MKYLDQLKSPKWQKKRLDILNIRGFKCEKCKSEDEQLHVHHRFYIANRKAWEYDNDVFQVLCHICHEIEHKKEDINKRIDSKWIYLIAQIELLTYDEYDNILSIIQSAKKFEPDLIDNIAGCIASSYSDVFFSLCKVINESEKLSIQNFILKDRLNVK